MPARLAAVAKKIATATPIAALLDGERSSAELADAIARAEGERDDDRARLETLRERRGDALLAEDTELVDQLDDEIGAVRRNIERLDLALGKLEDRRTEALEAERQAELEVIRERGLKAQAQGVSRMRKYGKLAADMAALMRELIVIEAEVERCNRELQGSDVEEVKSPNLIERHKQRELLAPRHEVEETVTEPAAFGGSKFQEVKRTRIVDAQYSPGGSNRPLPEEVSLPAADWSREQIWNEHAASEFRRNTEAQGAVRAKLGLESGE